MKPIALTAFALAAALAPFALASPLSAQETDDAVTATAEQTALEMRANQVVALLNGEIAPEDVLTETFTAQVPPAQLKAISAAWTAQYGKALSVEELPGASSTRSAIAIRMERAIARGGIAIDSGEDNRISELLIQSFDIVGDTPDKIAADLDALPGDVSYWFGPLDGGEPVLASKPEAQMPLGSTFKLYVLAALAREVAQGKRNWSDQATLGTLRSFPSGMMQDWPEDAPVTLHTLATMMIAISDNTATDQLIRVLGRDAVFETLVESGHSEPALNDPLLTTREMFLLKGGAAGRLATYQRGNADVRLQVLDGLESFATPASEVEAAFLNGPIALDVEWFASAADLAGLMRFMRKTADPEAFAIMGINPSMLEGPLDDWAYAGYKGGSEPGVLNLTWLLTDHAGRDHVLVLSWRNDEASLDASALEALAQRIHALPQ